ncbi:uncharacterized protein Dwil_GK27233 [Drosophila willistoni]|uniref:Uncharacterized protein n=2 Tax=Drosophila willistoni TaxID=7260 RepID=A0A0Q9WYW5_DROWI|nr:uncharacterized protein Dwil_GK27233 [Drosophila willistoni]
MSKTLKDLPNIEELHARLHFGKLSIENRRALEHLRNLKRLTLEASNYFGDELCRLSRLEYLEIGSHGFDAAALTECCITMGDLRHLNMGHKIEGLSTDHFITIAEECAQLERLAFGIRNLDTNVEYEFVCRLPKLQHLFVWINGAVRPEFLVGLINKVAQPKPIESLILVGSRLPLEQVNLVCQITSLKELDISCEATAIQDLLNLRNVKYLHLTMPEITNDQLKELILNLPQLILLNVRSCRLITEQFVASILELLPHIENRMRKKIKIHLKGSDINWSQIDHKLLQRKKAVVEIINETLEEPILIRQELTMNQSN